jgi:hypothetical protein
MRYLERSLYLTYWQSERSSEEQATISISAEFIRSYPQISIKFIKNNATSLIKRLKNNQM